MGDVHHKPRTAVGRLAALIYRSQPANGGFPTLYGVTGTNGKTTTTYFNKNSAKDPNPAK